MNRLGTALLVCALGASSAPAFASARLTAKPLPGQSLRAGTSTTLRFAVDEDVEEMEVLLSLNGGETFPVRVTREMSAGTHELTWRVPNLPTSKARLALRVGNPEEGEVIRDISEEFAILPAETEPFEDVRLFRGEWRAGEALSEIPSSAPFDAPGLGGASESIRSLGRETEFARTSDAAPTVAPPDRHSEAVDPIHRDRVSSPASRRVSLNLPRRE